MHSVGAASSPLNAVLPPLGLYVHLPWCERKCPYCDFNSHEARALPEAAYVDCLLDDLASQARWLGGRVVDTLFIGGGTPSLFSTAAIARLMGGIADRVTLAPSLEATMEANPGSAESQRFAAYRDAGINRISLGVQSFRDSALQALGRVHDSRQALDALAMIHEAGFINFNIDLMHGLPGQTAEQAARDLEQALAFDPPHLSWYQLTIEPNTAYYKRPPSLPEEDQLAAIQDAGECLLADAGLQHYEVSAFSAPGRECRHNLNYWQFGDYLAIGAGAHGKVTGLDGAVRRFRKRRQPDRYMAPPRGHGARWWRVSGEELRAEFMLYALRLQRGFTTSQLWRTTGLSLADLQPELGCLVEEGLLQQDGNRIHTTATGARFLDTVIGRFLPDAADDGLSDE